MASLTSVRDDKKQETCYGELKHDLQDQAARIFWQTVETYRDTKQFSR